MSEEVAGIQSIVLKEFKSGSMEWLVPDFVVAIMVTPLVSPYSAE